MKPLSDTQEIARRFNEDEAAWQRFLLDCVFGDRQVRAALVNEFERVTIAAYFLLISIAERWLAKDECAGRGNQGYSQAMWLTDKWARFGSPIYRSSAQGLAWI